MKKSQFKKVYYQSDSRRMPVKDFFKKELTQKELEEVTADIVTVCELGIVGLPLMEHVGKKVWEIRTKLPTRQVRVFCIIENNELVLLHAIIKKTQKTPQDALDLAYKRPKMYCRNESSYG